jgi:hypothetical protein
MHVMRGGSGVFDRLPDAIKSAGVRQEGHWLETELKIGGRDDVHERASKCNNENDESSACSSRSTLRERVLSRAAEQCKFHAV